MPDPNQKESKLELSNRNKTKQLSPLWAKKLNASGCQSANATTTPTKTVFKGAFKEFSGFIFDCTTNRLAYRYQKSIEEIERYILITFQSSWGADIAWSIRHETLYDVNNDRPTDLTTDKKKSETNILIHQEEIKEFVCRCCHFKQNMKSTYAIIIGQCTNAMKAKLQGLHEWEAIDCNQDTIKLIKKIKTLSFNFQEQKYLPCALINAQRAFYFGQQLPKDTNDDYYKAYKSHVNVLEQYGDGFGTYKVLLQEDANWNERLAMDSNKHKRTVKAAQGKFLGYYFIRQADEKHYGKLKLMLENQYTMGRNAYPTNLTAAYQMLTNYRSAKKPPQVQTKLEGMVAFQQQHHPSNNNTKPKDNNNSAPPDKKDNCCFNCNKKGHWANECPEAKEKSKKNQQDAGSKQNEAVKKEYANLNVQAEDKSKTDFCFAQPNNGLCFVQLQKDQLQFKQMKNGFFNGQ